jgi:hypothetical protein
MPSAYHSVRWRPLFGWLGRPLEGSPGIWQVPILPADFLTQSGAICLRTLAHSLLSAQEREEWRALKGPERNRIEWLFGRAAAKEAVRHWVQEQTGRLLYPTDIIVSVDPEGSLAIDGWWCDSIVAAHRVSLTRESGSYFAAIEPAATEPKPEADELEPMQRREDTVQGFAKELIQ